MNADRPLPPPAAGETSTPEAAQALPGQTPPEPAVDLLGLRRSAMAEALAPWIDKPFRARQIWDALHLRGVEDFAAMTDLSKPLRQTLASRFRIGRPQISERRAATDGTVKYLLRLDDGATIEAVDILDRRGGDEDADRGRSARHTLCISSQAGCALACAFCVTGYWGAGRNLTAGEIVGQVLALRATGELPEGINLVFMGMGEPLLNLPALASAFEVLTETISPRRITVSTAGVVPGIDALAAWPRRPNLAVSLHAADQELRSRIMPVNRTYPLAELMAALRRYPLESGRKITFEYILIRDLNDSPRHADELARLIAGMSAKVNLIPINPDPVLGADMVPPDPDRVDAFHRRLKHHGLISTVRHRKGDDVSAACGQLRAFGRDPRGYAGRSLGPDHAGHRPPSEGPESGS